MYIVPEPAKLELPEPQTFALATNQHQGADLLEEPPQLPPELAILQRPAERIAPHQRWQFVKGKWLGIFTLKVAGSSKSHSL